MRVEALCTADAEDHLTKPESPPSKALAIDIAGAASSKKAVDVRILEVRDLIVITDYFVICSGATDRQVRTIVQEIERATAARGIKPIRREGERDLRWVLIDYGDVVAHVFEQSEREYYELERLWKDAPLVDWERAPAVEASRV